MVLAHVYHRLSNLVPVLTVQVFKDDWTRGSSYVIGDMSKHLTAVKTTANRANTTSLDGSSFHPSKPPIFQSMLQNSFQNNSPNSSNSFNKSVSPDVSLTLNNTSTVTLPHWEAMPQGNFSHSSTNSASFIGSGVQPFVGQRPISNDSMYATSSGNISLPNVLSVGDTSQRLANNNRTIYSMHASGMELPEHNSVGLPPNPGHNLS